MWTEIMKKLYQAGTLFVSQHLGCLITILIEEVIGKFIITYQTKIKLRRRSYLVHGRNAFKIKEESISTCSV
jgi:hypothetical protein